MINSMFPQANNNSPCEAMTTGSVKIWWLGMLLLTP